MDEFYDVVDSDKESPDRVDDLVTGLNHMHSAPPPDAMDLTMSMNARF